MASFLASAYSRIEPLTRHVDHLVFKAYSHLRRRWVVLKGAHASDQEAVQGVETEFLRLRSLRHPALTGALGLEQLELTLPGSRSSTPLWCCVLPLAEGQSLKTLGQRPPHEVRVWLEQALELLAFLHFHRLTDLDLTPSHFIQTDARWMLIDFDQVREVNPFLARRRHGTLEFLAPEQLDGTQGGPTADLYSLGAIAYAGLIGTPPALEGSTQAELQTYFETHAVSPLPDTLQQADPALAALVQALLERKAGKRPASAEAALAALRGDGAWRRHAPCQRVPSIEDAVERPSPPLGQHTPWQECWEYLRAKSLRPGSRNTRVLVGPSGAGRTHFLEALHTALMRAGHPVLLLHSRQDEALSPSSQTASEAIMRWLGLLEGSDPGLAGQSFPLETAQAEAAAQGSGKAQALPLEQENRMRNALDRCATQILEQAATVFRHLKTPLVLLIDDAHTLDERDVAILAKVSSAQDGACIRLLLSAPEADLPGWSKPPTLPLERLEQQLAQELLVALLGNGVRATFDELTLLLKHSEGTPGGVIRCLTPLWAGLEAGKPLPESLGDFLTHSSTLSLEVGSTPSGAGSAEERQRALELGLDLEEDKRSGKDVPDEALAEAFLASSRPERAADALARLVDEARTALDYGRARRILRVWLERMQAPHRRIEPLERLGWLYLALQRNAEARKVFQQALDASQSAGTNRMMLRPLAQVEAGLGRTLMLDHRFLEAREHLEKALSLLPSEGDSELRARWQLWLSFLALHLKDPKDPGPALQRAEEALRCAETPSQNGFLKLEHAYVGLLLALEQQTASKVLLDRISPVLEQAKHLKATSVELRLVQLKLEILRREQRLEEALSLSSHALDLARATFNASTERELWYNLSLLYRDSHDESKASEALEKAIALSAHLGSLHHQRYRLERADLLLTSGRLDLAEAELQQLTFKEAEQTPLAWQHALLSYRLDKRQGRIEGLDAKLEVLEETVRAAGQEPLALEVASERVESLIGQGRLDRALEVCAHWAAEVQAGPNQAHAKMLLARTLQSLGGLVGIQVSGSSPVAEAIPSAQGNEQPAPGESSRSIPDERSRGAKGRDPLEVRTPRPAVEMLHMQEAQDALLAELLGLLKKSPDEATIAQSLAALAGRLLGGRGLVRLLGHPPVVAGVPMSHADARDVSKRLEEVLRREGQVVCEDVQLDPRFRESRSLQANARPGLLAYAIRGDKGEKGQAPLIGVMVVDMLETAQVTDPKVQALVAKLADTTGALMNVVERRIRAEVASRRADGKPSAQEKLEKALNAIARSPAKDLFIFLHGPIGAGKSWCAEEIHRRRMDNNGKFVEVNCSTLTSELAMSNVLGSVKGAFTHAINKPGYLETVGTGILFFDEVAELPAQVQTQLLLILANRPYGRMGEPVATRNFKGWMVFATNKDLNWMVDHGLFSEALYSRIMNNIIIVPYLRDRGFDVIRTMLETMVKKKLVDQGVQDWSPTFEQLFEPAGQRFLMGYDWPWNVRHISNLCGNEFAMGFVRKKEFIPLDILKKALVVRITSQRDTTPESQASVAVAEAPSSSVEHSKEGARGDGLSRVPSTQVELRAKMSLKQLHEEQKKELAQEVVQRVKQCGSVEAARESLKTGIGTVYHYIRQAELLD